MTVVSANSPPVAALSVSPSSGNAPLPVTADASASTDTDANPIASYRFDFGDGTAAVGPQAAATATHTYTAAGSYTVTVRVTDTAGLSSTATKTVTVAPASGVNVVTNFGFESSTSGWNNNGRTGITVSRVAGGHSGDWTGLLANNVWLKNARHANEMARLLEENLRAAGLADLVFPREANALFIHLPNEIASRVQARGWQFYKFIEPDVYRLMCSWATTEQDINDLAADLAP